MISMKTSFTYRHIALLIAMICGAAGAWGQAVKGDQYERYQSVNIKLSNPPTIKHKPAKWYKIRENVDDDSKGMDSFDDTKPMVDPKDNYFIQDYEGPIQSAHTYIDTIYMHRGTSITLELPDCLNGDNSVKAYQRWYSFRRDKTFETVDKSDGVYDLLTPASGNCAVRFANGYVGNPVFGSSVFGLSYNKNDNSQYYSAARMNFYMPTHEEFAKWFKGVENIDDRWFVVACDVSGYNDYTEEYDRDSSPGSVFYDGKQTVCWEPTLTHRVLFYILAVDGRDDESNANWNSGHGRLSSPDYQRQGRGYNETEKFLEEYTVIRPYYRLNNKQNHKKFSDALALSKDAHSYAIPGLDNTIDTPNYKLDVEIVENTAGIKLLEDKLKGASRLIQFDYPNQDQDNKMWSVNGTSATIIVTKTIGGITYNIARYKVTFDKEVTLLPKSIVDGLGENGQYANNDTWKDYRNRTPDYLEENYKLITSMTWDYDDNANNTISKGYYRYPMDWEYSSYGFYDGSDYNNYRGATANLIPEWGHYGITKNYIEKDVWGKYDGDISNPGGSSDGYHLYIDASDRPGTIAMMPFDETLCTGAELFVSAWVKEAGYDENNPGSGMLFTIVGVTTDANGVTRNVPLCRYSTGQFRRTTFLDSNIPGCGKNNNDWLHIYFSFINHGNDDYDSYLLQIDNNSVSTDGADMYLDDVRIYVAQPTAAVTQRDIACGDEATLMNIEFEWDRLISRTGGHAVEIEDNAELDNKVGAIDFCFVDQLKFYGKMAELTEAEANKDKDRELLIEESIEYAAVATGQGDYENKYSQLHYYIDYDKNIEYGDNGHTLAGENLIEFNKEKRGFFYKHTDADGIKNLSVDFMSTLSPNTPYWILIRMTNTTGKRPTAKDFASEFGDSCGIRTEFYIEGFNQIAIEGEMVDPTLNEYCEGQLLNFKPAMRYNTGDKDKDGNTIYEYIEEAVIYDWFLGSEDEYIAKNHKGGNGNKFSVDDALGAFRNAYPSLNDLPAEYDETGTDIMGGFSKAMYDVLYDYAKVRKTLLFSLQSLDLRLEEPGLTLVAKPVKRTLTTVDDDKVCWSYIPLSLRVVGGAPTLYAGYTGMSYPVVNTDGEQYSPNLRIGLSQIKKATDKANSIICNLRTPTIVSTDPSVTHVGTVTSHESDNKIYLVETNDPEMAKFLEPASDGQSMLYAVPIGQVDYLRAWRPDAAQGRANTVQFHFDLEGKLESKVHKDFKFNPREGYYYKFSVYFEEKALKSDGVSEMAGNACIGSLHITMYVVPEYVVWEGDATNNWNNDRNWKRVNSAERIKRDGQYDVYTERAFVPMQFSKVILNRDSHVELYPAGYDNSYEWEREYPGYIGEPTENIQYDLLVVEQPESSGDNAGRLTTERYRAYWIDKIHFEPDAEMRGAEYLIYNGAEIDYELEPDKWLPLTSPLKGTAAGDFYTDRETAVEQCEYFTDIKFDATRNSRLSPYVFQRDWDAESAMLMPISDTELNVAIRGNWSGVYNDVDEWETYQPGCGFSLKVTQMPTGSDNGDKALFRLPKADETYFYYDENGNKTSISKDIKSHKTDSHGFLISDGLYLREAYDYTSSDGEPITIDMPEGDQGIYYMIGNPFMTYLDVEKFFERNKDVLEQKYWMGNGDGAAAGTTDYGLVEKDDATGKWVTTKVDGEVNIAPLTAFFVQKKESAAAKITITQDMQAKFPEALKYEEESGTTGSGARQSDGLLRIAATDADGRGNTAAVRYAAGASVGYDDNEDVTLLMEPNIVDMPLVYTVGGDHALTINTSPGGGRIPLGVYSRSEETVTLRFTGSETCGDLRLYDAVSGRYTPLTEGFELSVRANDDGRYYLVGGSATGITSIGDASQGDISIYSVRRGEITVASGSAPLSSVQVNNAGGTLVATARDCGTSARINVTPGMVYIVKATDINGFCRTAKVKELKE